MEDYKLSEVKEIYGDIVKIFETENSDAANRLLDEGARLLCFCKNPPDFNYSGMYILGWPKSAGKPPEHLE